MEFVMSKASPVGIRLAVMVFGQLSNLESLRDVVLATQGMSGESAAV